MLLNQTLLFVIVFILSVGAVKDSSLRVTVIRDKDQYMGFVNRGGKLQLSLSTDSLSWGNWLVSYSLWRN